MHTLSSSLLLASAAALAAANPQPKHPRPVSLPFHRRETMSESLSKRASGEPVTLQNIVQHGLYAVNASVGSPGQTVTLQLDTGSSDVWMFSPAACSDVQCSGGSFNPTDSSSYQTLDALGPFEIQYDTPGSIVKGTYFTDDYSVGDIQLTNNIMALAEEAKATSQGIMGIGFPTDETIFGQTRGQKYYNNTVLQMVEQGVIPSVSYSLYLDDVDAGTGTVIFGGYDTKKYVEPLTVLDIVPSPEGIRNEMAVSWTYLALSDSKGTTLSSPSSFPLTAVLDSGTTLTRFPAPIFQPIADYFGAFYYEKIASYLVPCAIANWTGTLDYGFGGGAAVIQVPFAELAIPLTTSGPPPTLHGVEVCSFGLDTNPSNGDVLLGDTFLRSAYVIYDLEAFQIAIGQTVFNEDSSDVKPIASGSNLASVLGSGVKTATTITAVPTHSFSNMTMTPRTKPATNTGSVSGVTTSLPITSTATESPGTLGTGGSTSSSKAAAAAPTEVAGARTAMAGGSLLALLMFGLF